MNFLNQNYTFSIKKEVITCLDTNSMFFPLIPARSWEEIVTYSSQWQFSQTAQICMKSWIQILLTLYFNVDPVSGLLLLGRVDATTSQGWKIFHWMNRSTNYKQLFPEVFLVNIFIKSILFELFVSAIVKFSTKKRGFQA